MLVISTFKISAILVLTVSTGKSTFAERVMVIWRQLAVVSVVLQSGPVNPALHTHLPSLLHSKLAFGHLVESQVVTGVVQSAPVHPGLQAQNGKIEVLVLMTQ